MPLSSEDTLRIHVLLANQPLAIKLDESSMTLFGLTEQGDAQVKLNPNCRDDKYIKEVKEVLSSHVSGSPGGYPVFIQRWTRMGQMRDDNLEQLLLLGESEAVVAVTCAAGLTDELARRAWWAMEDADNARRMLEHEAIVHGQMGKILANYLIEFLPFETEAEIMIESVRLVLQAGLTPQKIQETLWKKGGRKSAYHVGFLLSIPDQLPVKAQEHPLYASLKQDCDAQQVLHPFQQGLLKVLSSQGQAFLSAFENILKKPSNQEVVSLALDAVRYYFVEIRPEGDPDQTLEQLRAESETFVQQYAEQRVGGSPLEEEVLKRLKSLRVISGLGYGVLRPFIQDSTAIGSLMRRKLEPVFQPIREEIKILSS